MKFIEDHFDKLLVASLFLFMVFITIYLAKAGAGVETISWAREIISGFEGALLGLVTGAALANRGNTTETSVKVTEVSEKQ